MHVMTWKEKIQPPWGGSRVDNAPTPTFRDRATGRLLCHVETTSPLLTFTFVIPLASDRPLQQCALRSECKLNGTAQALNLACFYEQNEICSILSSELCFCNETTECTMCFIVIQNKGDTFCPSRIKEFTGSFDRPRKNTQHVMCV